MRIGRVNRYLERLDELSGGVEPEFWQIESTKAGLPGVTGISYRGLPEPGFLLGLTYGLSVAEHDRWEHGRPELCICVRADDPVWVQAVATLAEDLRGDCPFEWGDTINFGQAIAPGSAMDGFLVSVPLVLDADDALIEVGDDHPLHLQGMYPTYRSERQFVREHGLDAFMRLDWDPYDVNRPAAVGT